MQAAFVAIKNTMATDLYNLPESLEITEVQDKFRKLLLQFLPLNDEITKSAKVANPFLSSLLMVQSAKTVVPSLYKAIKNRKISFPQIAGVLVMSIQGADLITTSNKFKLFTINKIVGFAKSIDVFKFSKNLNLNKHNVLAKLTTIKESCVFVNTAISLYRSRDKAIFDESGTLDVRLLIKRTADSFKLAIVGLSLANSLTRVGNISFPTRFGPVTPGKVIEGLSYFSTTAAFFKSLSPATAA